MLHRPSLSAVTKTAGMMIAAYTTSSVLVVGRRSVVATRHQRESALRTSSSSTASGDGLDDRHPLSRDEAFHHDDEEDCPMCRAMLAGPCASQFRTWLDCTRREEEDGKDHVARCKKQFEALHVCLEENDKEDG